MVWSNEMRYKEGSQDERSYDACHYEVNKWAEMSDKALQKIKSKSNVNTVKLYVKFNKKKNMNVYIYEGKDRNSSTKSLIPKNEQAMINNIYEININSGMLIVAYPNKD